LLKGETRKRITQVILIAIIAATLPLTIVAAESLNFEKADLPFDLNISQQIINPEVTQQPQNKTAELPKETVPPSIQKENRQPAGSVIPGNVGIYTDSACTQPLTSIDWGSFSPGDSVNRTIYVKNAQSIPLTLNMSTINWNPIQAAESIKVTWNKENVILASQQSTEAILTLTVASNISGISQFSVDILINGVQ
jgi:hypothetical protein